MTADTRTHTHIHTHTHTRTHTRAHAQHAEEGDEIHFFHTHKVVEGYVINIGWYRTQVGVPMRLAGVEGVEGVLCYSTIRPPLNRGPSLYLSLWRA
jgi:hypothetical protein